MFNEHNRPEPPLAASPEAMVGAFMDFQRATLLWKVSGLSEKQLRRPMAASGTSLLGVLKHSAYVERWWFHIIFAGLDVQQPWTKDDPDADWRIEPGETAEQIVALYESACATSREVVANAKWSDLAKKPRPHETGLTLGWIMTHMLEEIARHVGQVDIMREAIDGLVGE